MTTDPENSSPQPLPVLGYATPAADGLPEWHAEAEALIDAGKHPKTLRKLFPRSEDAIRYYAKSLARRHGIDSVGSTCLVCGTTDIRSAVEAHWIARIPFRFGEFRLSSTQPTATFKTLHALCPDCYGAWLQKQLRYVVLSQLFFWANLLAVFCLIVTPIVLSHVTGRQQRGSNWLVIQQFTTCGILVLFAISRKIIDWRFRRFSMHKLVRVLPRYVAFAGVSELVGIVNENGRRATAPLTDV